MHPVISVDAAHLKSASKGTPTIFVYSGLTGNDEANILVGILSIHCLQKPVHQCHFWKMVMHIPSSCSSLTGIKDWLSPCPKFSQGIMQQIVFIILSRM